MNERRCSLLLTNWNGVKNGNLPRFLPRIWQAAQESELTDEVILVDDGSSDGSCAFVRSEFPDVHLISLSPQRGVAAAANAGFRVSRNRFVAMLSNDMVPQPDWLDYMLAHFDDPDVFAVSARLFFPDGKPQSFRRAFQMKRGRLKRLSSPGGEPTEEQAAERRFLHAGDIWSLYDREKFLSIGGFDEDLFTPFFSEDEDLCYRAWKRGWKVTYEPRAHVVHHHEYSTVFRGVADPERERIYRGHQLLHAWKNLDDPALRAQHFASLTLRFCLSWIFDRAFYDALRYALGKRAIVNRKRAAERSARQLTDRQLMQRMTESEAIRVRGEGVGERA